MVELYLKLFNMSITASWLILAVVILRLLLKKSPKYITCIMWALVAVRLICPFSFESVLSLVPSAETVPTNITTTDAPVIESGIPVINDAVNQVLSQSFQTTGNENVNIDTNDILVDNDSKNKTEKAINPLEAITKVASVIWSVGLICMIIYALISYLAVKSKVREAIPYKENIWICDHIGTPFILGIFKPRIFLCSAMTQADEDYVIAHENAHLKRLDHLWKPLGFILLTVYWFNPLVWLAYILFCRDIELACDEKVIKAMDTESKKAYSNALISCSAPGKLVAVCPLAFGEGKVAKRVKSILHYKKPAVAVISLSIIACVVIAVCFLTNPIKSQAKPENNSTTNNYEIKEPEYKEIIAGIQEAYKDNFETVTTDDLGISFVYSLYNWEDTKIGYYIADLDNNGVNELLLGDSSAIIRFNVNTSTEELIAYDSIYDIFTIYNGMLIHVFNGGERNVLYPYENNILKNETSSGASESSFAYYVYNSGSLPLIEAVLYNGENSGSPWMYTTELDWYYIDSSEPENISKYTSPITEEEAYKIEAKYKPIDLELIPLNSEIINSPKEIPILKELEAYYHSTDILLDILSKVTRDELHDAWGEPESSTEVDNMIKDVWSYDNENFKGHKIGIYYDTNDNIINLDFFYIREE